MSKPKRVTDPVVKTRYCDDCRAVIVGITDIGLTWWLDATPITPELERIYHAAGRATYLVRPRPGRSAWIDWRNPLTAHRTPTRGILLVAHPHRRPGAKAAEPDWLISDHRVTAVPHNPTEPLF